MDIIFTSLEALILKATLDYLPTPDGAALDAFCVVMKDSPDGPALAAKALAERIQSGSVKESLLALVAVDRCMRRCGAAFHMEVGKFRFLNELIKLVSPKYYAKKTPPEVQQRVLQLLHAWSIEYPKETKFKVAYDMLRNQGVIRETPPPLPPEHGAPEPPPPRPRAAAFEDDEKSKLLQKLLQSKNPDDLQYANKLIKNMVKEEERRSEAAGQRSLSVRSAVESARLLNSLLEGAASAGNEEKQLMGELHNTCRQHHRTLTQLVACTDKDDTGLEEIFQAVDELTEVFNAYNSMDRLKSKESRVNGSSSLLDLAGLHLGDAPKEEERPGSGVDAFGDIFGTENGPSGSQLLKPVSLISVTEANEKDQQRSAAGFASLDSLGTELLQRSLPGARVGDGFAGKSTKKIPMNAIEKISAPAEKQTSQTLDLDFLINKTREAITKNNTPKHSPHNSLDDLILDIAVEASKQNVPTNVSTDKESTNRTKTKTNDKDSAENLNEEKQNERSKEQAKLPEVVQEKREAKSLSDVEISLSNVQASSVPPITLLEEPDGLTVAAHLATNRPRPDVNVLVLSTTSKHKSPVSDYKFHAVVPKGCRVRLLAASGACLPPHSPFLQPAAVIQLMLLGRPGPEPPATVPLKFVVTYYCGGDAVTEMGEAELPLDQV